MDIVTMLQQCPESLPAWLREPPRRFDRKTFFGGRTIYYPGFGNDGHPVSLCARSHAAHAFVYVDYGESKETVRERVHGIGDPGFIGYSVEHEEVVSESDLRPGGWTQHVEQREIAGVSYSFANVTPYGLFIALRRDKDRDESHGPERLRDPVRRRRWSRHVRRALLPSGRYASAVPRGRRRLWIRGKHQSVRRRWTP